MRVEWTESAIGLFLGNSEGRRRGSWCHVEPRTVSSCGVCAAPFWLRREGGGCSSWLELREAPRAVFGGLIIRNVPE